MSPSSDQLERVWSPTQLFDTGSIGIAHSFALRPSENLHATFSSGSIGEIHRANRL